VPKIFVSYAREDQAAVVSLARGLQRVGFDVWWDTYLEPGSSFRTLIEQNLREADVVVVVWSKRSKLSRWVLDEAELGVQRGILLPVQIDRAPLPLGFGGFHTLDFSAWKDDFNALVWRKLLSEIDRIAAAPVLPGKRSEIRVLPRALAVAATFGAVAGGLIWGLYALGNTRVVRDSLLGHPIIDSFMLAFIATVPVALWSAIEVKRAGFDSLRGVLARAAIWMFRGCMIALAILIAAIAGGATTGPSSTRLAGDTIRFFVVASLASACLLTGGHLLWFAARRVLGRSE
jgi:hypothetical protein